MHYKFHRKSHNHYVRLIVRKALNFVNRDDQQSFKKDDFTKTSKIGPSMESLNADFFSFLLKLLKVLF